MKLPKVWTDLPKQQKILIGVGVPLAVGAAVLQRRRRPARSSVGSGAATITIPQTAGEYRYGPSGYVSSPSDVPSNWWDGLISDVTPTGPPVPPAVEGQPPIVLPPVVDVFGPPPTVDVPATTVRTIKTPPATDTPWSWGSPTPARRSYTPAAVPSRSTRIRRHLDPQAQASMYGQVSRVTASGQTVLYRPPAAATVVSLPRKIPVVPKPLPGPNPADVAVSIAPRPLRRKVVRSSAGSRATVGVGVSSKARFKIV